MPQDKRRINVRQLGKLLCLLSAGAIGLGLIGMMLWRRIPEPRAVAQNSSGQDSEDAVIAVPVTRQLAARVTSYDLPRATVQVALFPTEVITISVAVSDALQPIDAFVAGEISSTPTSIINGGFFDPQNGKTTSHLTVGGEVVGDPADNERLVGNPDLQQYLPQILNRSEFRAYRCDLEASARGSLRYDVTLHDAAVPDGCEIECAVGAGPQLLPDDTSELEAFTAYENGELVRDAIGSMNPNARSAIGIDADGAVYFIMVEKTAELPGLTLAEVSEFAASLGVVKLLNLDGGSSSSLRFADQTFYGRFDPNGSPIERPVKSVIFAQ